MWIWIALVAPALYGLTNIIDKYLVKTYRQDLSPGTLVFFMGIFSLFVVPFLAFLVPTSLDLEHRYIIKLIISGIITTLAWIPYMYALEDHDMSMVMPLYQLMPVMTFVLAYFYLGESLSSSQMFGSFIIIIGAILLAREPQKPWHVSMRLIGLIFVSSLLLVVSQLLFKDVAIAVSYQNTLFWFFCGHVLASVLIFCNPFYTREIIAFLKKINRKFFGLFVINESLGMAGDAFAVYAILLAPVALVNAVGGFQGVFVFIYGLIVTWGFPFIFKEDISRSTLIRKIAALALMVFGGFIVV